jgi:predicted outer membrane repeat protein
MNILNRFSFSFVVMLTISIFTLTADAATYIVTNTDNDGAGSLRDAIITANSTGDDDTINFNIPADDSNCVSSICSINLLEQLTTSGNLNIINSTGANKLRLLGIVSSGGAVRVLGVAGGSTMIDGVSFANGSVNAGDNGGCISNSGSLTLKNSVVSGCQTILGGGGGGNGAGIANYASLTLLKTTVTNNLMDGTIGGGGIFNSGGTTTITDSTISGNSANYGGGIYSDGVLTITNSTVSGNSQGGIASSGLLVITNSNIVGNSSDIGGGIEATLGTITVTNSNISGNSASVQGGGIDVGNIDVAQNVTLIDTTVRGNSAGNGSGIFNNGANITIRDSTIDKNMYTNPGNVGLGGGIYNFSGRVNLINSTVSRNVAGIFGGIYNNGDLYLINSTVTQNSVNFGDHGAGIFTDTALTLRNSIVAGNIAKGNPDIEFNSGTLTSQGNNLIGNSDTAIPASWQSTDILDQPARLGPIGNYGGATETYALTNSSRAINAGNSCVVTLNGCGDGNQALAFDQRAATRVGTVDIGAFERNNTANGGTFRAVTFEGTRNRPFSYQLTPDSGAFAYSVTAGGLPPGLSITSVSIPSTSGKLAKLSLAPQAAVVSIAGTPTMGGTFNYTITASDGTNSVSTEYTTNIVVPPPTAASVQVGGRVTALGRGLPDAQVTLSDQNGQTRTALTNAFGYYQFENVTAGETYIISIRAKRYQFAPQLVSVATDVTDLEFSAE